MNVAFTPSLRIKWDSIPTESLEHKLKGLMTFDRVWETGDKPFEDMELAWEMTHHGLSLQSSFEAGIHLVPNYQKFWSWLRVARAKEDAKIKGSDP